MFGAGTDVFAVWGYVIAHAVDSSVELNPKLLSSVLGASPDRIEAAIEFLCSPDPQSRNPEHEGKRLVRKGPFQFHVVSHQHYRAIRNEDDRKEYNRLKQQESRARRRDPSTQVSLTGIDSQSKSTLSAHTEADTDTETREADRPSSMTSGKQVASPVNPDAGAELALASWLFEEWGVPSDFGTRDLASQAIRLLAKEGGTVKQAAEFILQAGKQAREAGETINRFWFTDQKYRGQEKSKNSPMSKMRFANEAKK